MYNINFEKELVQQTLLERILLTNNSIINKL